MARRVQRGQKRAGTMSYSEYMSRLSGQNGVYSWNNYERYYQKDRQRELQRQFEQEYRQNELRSAFEKEYSQQQAVENANKAQQDGYKRTMWEKMKPSLDAANKAQQDGFNRTKKEKEKQLQQTVDNANKWQQDGWKRTMQEKGLPTTKDERDKKILDAWVSTNEPYVKALKEYNEQRDAYNKQRNEYRKANEAKTTAWKDFSQQMASAGAPEAAYALKMMNDTKGSKSGEETESEWEKWLKQQGLIPGEQEQQEPKSGMTWTSKLNKNELQQGLSKLNPVTRPTGSQPYTSQEQMKAAYDQLQDKSSKAEAARNLDAYNLATGNISNNGWLGGQTEEYKRIMANGYSPEMRERIENLRQMGAFDSQNDKKIWSKDQREMQKAMYRMDIASYKNLMDEIDGERAQRSTETQLQRLAELSDGNSGRAPMEVAGRFKNDFAGMGMTLDEYYDQLGEEKTYRRIYDGMNGRGAYDRAVTGMAEEERQAFDKKIKDAADYALGADWRGGEYNGYQDKIDYYNREIKALDYLDQVEKDYGTLMGDWQMTGAEYDPTKSLITDSEGNPLYSSMELAAPVDRVYDILGGEDRIRNYKDDSWQEYNNAKLMTPAEKDKFLTYYNNGQKKEAWAFYQALEPTLNQYVNMYEYAEQSYKTANAPVTMFAARTLTLPVQTVETLMNLPATVEAMITGKPNGVTDPYGTKWQFTRFRQTVTEELTKNAGDLGWMVSGVASGLDSAFNASIAKGLGLAEGAAQTAMLALFGTQAFGTSLYNNMKTSNGNFGYAAVEAFLDAAIETATEIWSVENWLADPTNILTYVGKIALSEPSEEIVGAIMEPLIKEMTGHRNQYKDRASEIYVHEGYTDAEGNFIPLTGTTEEEKKDEATRIAMKEWVHDIRMAAQEALLSVGPSMAYGSAQIAAKDYAMGSALTSKNSPEEIAAMAAEAAKADVGKSSRRQSEGVLKKIFSDGKVGNFQAGRMLRSISQDTNTSIGEKAEGVRLEQIQEALQERGVDKTQAVKLSETIAKAVEAGDISKLTKDEQREIKANAPAMITMKDFMGDEQTKQKLQQGVNEAAKEEIGLRQSVSEMMTKRVPVYKPARRRNVATEDDIANARGEEVKGAMGAIVYQDDEARYGKIISLTKQTDENGNTQFKYIVEIGGETVYVDAAQIRTKNEGVAAIVESHANNPLLYSHGYVNKMLQMMDVGRQEEHPGNFMAAATSIRMAAFKQAAMPKVDVPENVAKELYDFAKSEMDAIREKETEAAQRNAHKAGEGIAALIGKDGKTAAQFGTDEFDRMLKESGLSRKQQRQVKDDAALAQAMGSDVTFVNNEWIRQQNKKEKSALKGFEGAEEELYGNESRQGIIINLDGQNKSRNLLTGEIESTGTHNYLVTLGHEMTHWLQRNSRQRFDELAKYVLDEQQKRAGAAKVNERLMWYMQTQGLTLDEAISEYVADSCDSIFSNGDVLEHIRQTNETLFTQVKDFVRDMIARMKNALNTMKGSMSQAGLEMLNSDMRELAKRFNLTWDESVENEAKSAEEQESTVNEGRYSVAELRDGTRIAIEDENILDLKPAEMKMSDFIHDYLEDHINDSEIAESTSDVIYLGEELPHEYISSEYTKDLLKGNRKKLIIKNRAAGMLLDAIVAADKKTGPEQVKHNQNKDAKYGIYRFNTRLAFPVKNQSGEIVNYNVYTAKMIVNHTSEGKLELYDILDINKDDQSALKMLNESAHGPLKMIRQPKVASESKITQSEKNGKSRNSRAQIDDQYMTANEKEGFSAETMVDDIDNMESVGNPSANSINDDIDTVKLDQEYEEAVERGDLKTATEMLMKKLRATEGVVPFIAPEWDTGEYRQTAKMLKVADPESIAKAADEMAEHVPENAVLIPMPGREGKLTEDSWSVKLANAISERTGRPVVIALEGAERESRQEAKHNGGQGASQEELGFRKIAEIPEGTFPIFVDNVVGKGVTADAARQAMGGGITLAYTKTLRSPGIVGLKNVVVTHESQKNGGGLIPLSERFNVSKRDVRYSQWTEEGMDVNTWMMNATASTVQTEDERTLLQAYRDLRIKMSLSLKKQLDYQAKVRQLESKATLTQEQKDDLTATRNRLEIEKNKLARMEDELYSVTSDSGFAGIMYRENMKLKDYIEGKTQDQVRQSVEDMLKLVQKTQETIRKDTEELKQLAEAQAVKTMKSYLGKSSLSQMASMLRKANNSTMSKAEISDRLAEMALKQASGQDIQADTEALARELINKMRGTRTDALDYLNGTTLNIGESLLDEYIAENRITEDVKKGKNATEESVQRRARQIALRQIRAALKGSGVNVIAEGNSRLDEQWSELRENNMGLVDISDMNPSDGLNAVIDFVSRNVQDSMGMNQYDIDFDEKALMVRAAVGNITTYLTDDPAARKQIQGLMTQIAELSKKTEATAADMERLNAQLDDVILAGQKAKGWTTVLQRDVNDAIKYYNKTAKVAAETERNKVRKQLIEQLKSENTKKLIEQQAKFNEAIQNDQKARELAQDNAKLRSRIHTVASRMANRIFAETDQKNVPEETKPLVRQVLQMLGMHDSAFRKVTGWDRKQVSDILQRITRMNERFGEFDAERDLDWMVVKATNPADNDTSARDKIWQDIVNIETGLLEYRNAEGQGRISLQDRKTALTKVQEAMSEIWSAVQARGQAEINGRKWQVIELAEMMRDDMEKSRMKGERIGFGSKARNAAANGVTWGNLTPEYFFKMLKNKAITLLQDGLHEGENKSGLQAYSARQRLAKIAEDNGYATWDGQEEHKVKTNSGEITMTTEQIMALYATWMRESSQLRPEETAHLLKGGFVLAQKENNKGKPGWEKRSARPIRISEAQLNALRDLLTDNQLKFVHDIVEYMSTDLAEIGNEASMKMFGIKKFTERFYFPIKSWGGVLNSRSDNIVRNSNENRAARQSFSKRVQANASNAIEIGDFTPTVVQHVAGMITYNTVAPAIENLNKVLNQQLQYGEIRYTEEGEEFDDTYKQNMKAVFQQAYGSQALDYLDKFMKDMNGGVGSVYGNTVWDTLLSAFKRTAVAGSLSVAAQQPLSYIRAAMMVSPKYLAQAVSPQYWKGSYAEMMKYSGVACIKEMGKFDMNYGRSMRDWITPEGMESKGRKAWNWIEEKSTILPQKMDAMTWTRMWTAVKLEQMAQNKGMDLSSDEFMQKVAERFNDVMRKTQVYDSVMVKSQNMRNQNQFAKTITSFMAEPTLSLNVLADAMQNIREKGGKEKAAKALVTFLLSAVAQAAVKAAFSTGRTPDKKKTELENYLYRMSYNLVNEGNPLGLIPGYSYFIDLLKDGEMTDNAMSVVGKAKDIWTALSKMYSSVKAGEQINLYRSIEDTAGQAMQLFSNVPLKNMMRDFRAIVNLMSGGAAEQLTGGTYAKRETSQAVLKYQLIDTVNKEDLIGLVNMALGEAGWTALKDNGGAKAYYQRIYDAEKSGDKQSAKEMKEYVTLTSNAQDPEGNMNSALKTLAKNDESLSAEQSLEKQKEYGLKQTGKYVLDQYKEGRLTRKDAERLYKQENPKASDKDVMEALDKIDWEKAGNDGEKYSNYTPVYAAIDKGDEKAFQQAVKKLTSNAYKEKDVMEEVAGYVAKKYKEGKMSRTDAETWLKKNAKMTADDAWWKLDRIDYKKETGKDAGTGTYYRLYDAIENNRSEEIKAAVNKMVKHGMKAENIKDQIGKKYRQAYLNATGAAKTKLQDALTKAYKAVGLTADEALKIINGWKPKKTGK